MFNVLLRKELLETFRSYRWLWLPVFFIGLAIMQPLLSFYMEDIVEQFGSMPEGTMMTIPTPSAEQVYSETLGQFTQIGTFTLVLAFMGSLSNERKSGEALLTLSKPTKYYAYWFSKWVSALGITTVSYLVGITAAIYYIFALFEPLPAGEILLSTIAYLVWLMFVVTIVLVWSTVSKHTSVAAAGALITLLLLNVSASLFGDLMSWTPGILPGIAAGVETDTVVIPIIVSLMLIAVLITASIRYMKKTDWLM
ncbi:ABC transporter permease subunit [Salicibibacter cibi]|uniref:ABC transporter permease subunit n=1 Tax=Salicibibacter cibi TaxID=2743001 RepID=A0A7T6ZDE6_9BACI|nr:ABC transporter permease subunit [Salicibibacter cibi]QQK81480.1 ABC transporter permease subunit [Salicibibacter cibi]